MTSAMLKKLLINDDYAEEADSSPPHVLYFTVDY